MPDITLCTNFMCLKRHDCLRFRAKAAEHQSYQTFYPEDDGTCESFLSIPEGANLALETTS
ncbi:hypothetical protein [Parvibaculum sp.]|uniref:hypothetical protein n=1 Tax=Parvibaculum sp. TaxID=2024848 RepID=UPI002735A79D|nr:hypothetical protein [Parvibaculum sp.]MDP3328745.1 hypothetical protein [Parvibaculum sp.]